MQIEAEVCISLIPKSKASLGSHYKVLEIAYPAERSECGISILYMKGYIQKLLVKNTNNGKIEVSEESIISLNKLLIINPSRVQNSGRVV